MNRSTPDPLSGSRNELIQTQLVHEAAFAVGMFDAIKSFCDALLINQTFYYLGGVRLSLHDLDGQY